MRIYYEILDDENYIELCLTPDEAHSLWDQQLISKGCEFEDRRFFFGARLLTESELEDDKYLF